MKILAIESTCDETAAALVETCGGGVKVIRSVIASSVEMHQKYGGIVPEVAAREQIRSIIPVITEAVGGEVSSVEAIAVSYGPGLMGSLLVGVETAKVLSWTQKKKILKVNHMTGHVLANWIVEGENEEVPKLPAIGLVVSGGHTDLILLKTMKDWQWIGGTRDDAAGEAFDKVARLLELPYPGGPEIDKAAQQVSENDWEKYHSEYKLPRPLINDPGLEMSFSGLKAAVSRMVENEKVTGWIPDQVGNDRNTKRNIIAREFSEAATEVLTKKTLLAVEKYKPKSVILAGGVAANKRLRERLKLEIEKLSEVNFFVPELKYCGDNAAMIGAAAILRPEETTLNLRPEPSLATV